LSAGIVGGLIELFGGSGNRIGWTFRFRLLARLNEISEPFSSCESASTDEDRSQTNATNASLAPATDRIKRDLSPWRSLRDQFRRFGKCDVVEVVFLIGFAAFPPPRPNELHHAAFGKATASVNLEAVD